MPTATRNRVLPALLVAVLVIAAAAFLAKEGLEEIGIGQESQEQLAREASITPQQAEAAALAALPGSVEDVELDRENGRVVYQVDIQPAAGGDDMEVRVDAVTGEVLEVEED